MVRVLSGAVLVPLVVGAVWFLTPLALLGVAEVVLALAFVEYARLAAELGARIPKAAAGAAAMVTCAAVAWPGQPVEVALMAAVLAVSSVALGSGRRGLDALQDVAIGLFGSLYLGLPLGSLVAVHWFAGREAALLLLVVVMVSDTAQYYSGRLLGRHALAPQISPKKTVEGALGGFIAGALTMAGLGGRWLPEIATGSLAAVGLIVVGLGIVGDLFESLLKRGAGVKDSSGLIPGHGGVLDRIDALLFAAPAYYIFVRYMT